LPKVYSALLPSIFQSSYGYPDDCVRLSPTHAMRITLEEDGWFLVVKIKNAAVPDMNKTAKPIASNFVFFLFTSNATNQSIHIWYFFKQKNYCQSSKQNNHGYQWSFNDGVECIAINCETQIAIFYGFKHYNM